MSAAHQKRYRGPFAEHILWPLGGVGAAKFGLCGDGGLDLIANRHRPDIRNLRHCFAALAFPGRPDRARVLEGPIPQFKRWTNGLPGGHPNRSCAFGQFGGMHFGFPRFGRAEFLDRFPFATVRLRDDGCPLAVEIEAWSPFIPGEADVSGLPVAALTYRLRNPGRRRCRCVFSFHARTEILRARGEDFRSHQPQRPASETIRRTERGFAFEYAAGADQYAGAAGGFVAELDGAAADCAWFRGGWFDAASVLWRRIAAVETAERKPHAEGSPGDGASLYLPLDIPAGGEANVTLRLAWYEPVSDLRLGADPEGAEGDGATYRPHYATRFSDVAAVADEFRNAYADFERRTRAFADTLHAGDLPRVAREAVTANLGILRSPTVLRQHDGRLWCWEGVGETDGCCHGTCTHVWNYAQAIAHLFPVLERTLRDSEFGESQDERGHQHFRTNLPIRPCRHDWHAAADGQLGGIVKVWRDWQISGDEAWLRRLWPRVRKSLEYCIATWDPDRTGALIEPHHNTYDIEFWGPDGMCGSFYAAALAAAAELAAAVGEDPSPWRALLAKAVAYLNGELFQRGRYIQRVLRAAPRAGDAARQAPTWSVSYTPEALALLAAEGPKYQYGDGVLSEGVLGAWLAEVSGQPSPLPAAKVRSHLQQVVRHNLRRDLRDHVNPQRPGYALGGEGGLLLCSWPDGSAPTLPFVYSNEVWTGIEYQVASHCILHGLVEEGLEIVRILRKRYDGRRRNPFDEYECGHWYGRALSSWALVYAWTGVRYSAVERTLWIAPATAKRPFTAPLVHGGNFGTVTLRRNRLSVALSEGEMEIARAVVCGKPHPWGATARARQPAILSWI